jgi:predicted SAM-dependent methyltransferase
LLDLEAAQARLVINKYSLSNVNVIENDAALVDFTARPFDTAVAADVLEHFKDLNMPTQRLHQWIKPGGMLFTSLPTENWVYVFLRKVFGVEKPWDHYHTGYEVEAHLARNGFRRMKTTCVPLRVSLAPLFLITAWRRE